MRDELLEQFGDRGAGPGDPPFGVEESALLLAGQQRFAVVQLADEVDAGLGRLERIEHLKSGTRHPALDVEPVEHVVGHEVRGNGAEVGWDAHRKRGQRVDR